MIGNNKNKIVLTALYLAFMAFISVSGSLCDEFCMECTDSKDACKECQDGLYRSKVNGSCLCKEGYFENEQVVCEEEDDNNQPLYVFICILALIIFLGVIFNIYRLNPLNLFQLLPSEHHILEEKKVHIDEGNQEEEEQEEDIDQTMNLALQNPQKEQAKKDTEPVAESNANLKEQMKSQPEPEQEEEEEEEKNVEFQEEEKKQDLDIDEILNQKIDNSNAVTPQKVQQPLPPLKVEKDVIPSDVFIPTAGNQKYTPWAVLKKQQMEKKKLEAQKNQFANVAQSLMDNKQNNNYQDNSNK